MRFWLLLAFASFCFAVGCQRNQDCYEVSLSPSSVSCVDKVCQCINGFDGSATVKDKCRCTLPKFSIPYSGQFYCLNLASAIELEYNYTRCQILKQKVQTIYDYIIYPRNLAVIQNNSVLDDVFGVNSTARITPLGDFEDREGVIEYFYGIASTTASFVSSFNFRLLSCEGNMVWVRVDILLNQTLNSIAAVPILNVTHWGRFEFDNTNTVIKTDLTFPNLGNGTDTPDDGVLITLAPGFVLPRRQAEMFGVCNLIQEFCVGDNVQFSSVDECFGFMLAIPYGSFDRANSNTFTCRSVHTQLTPFRPQIHCPHAGPTGGNACIDFPYDNYYTVDNF